MTTTESGLKIMSNKHLPHDLSQMQSLPLEAKIIMTQQRIRQWHEYWEGQVYVGFSGGKDSTVLKHIVADVEGCGIAGQTNIFDALEDYDSVKLKTTGCDRTGCIFCMFGCHLEKEPNRFQRLKETHPRQYEYCINGGEMVEGKWQPNKEGLGLAKVLDYIGVNYE